MNRKKAAVLFGGVSSEYEVSLQSAASVIENFPLDLYELVTVGITRDGRWLLSNADVRAIREDRWQEDAVPAVISPDRATHGLLVFSGEGTVQTVRLDVVFPVMHGRNGEDGRLQGLLAIAGIPCVGCDTLSSAVCMDKAITNMMLDSFGIPHTPWTLMLREQFGAFETQAPEWERKFGYPIFVKPANAGSSVGISKARNREELRAALELAFLHDRKAVIEKAVIGRELECAVIGNLEPYASEVSEILPSNDFYDYDAKYQSDSTTVLPADISESLRERIRTEAVRAYLALGCKGLTRVDFLYDPASDILYLNEPNTLPGFTAISMYPKMMAASGMPFSELIVRLLGLAQEDTDG